jgi:hypothetical protein
VQLASVCFERLAKRFVGARRRALHGQSEADVVMIKKAKAKKD